MPTSAAGAANGHHIMVAKKRPSSKKLHHHQQDKPFISSKKGLSVFLGSLAAFTIFIDGYFLTSKDLNLGKMNLKRRPLHHPGSIAQIHKATARVERGAHAKVDKAAQRKFAFQDPDHHHNLLKLEKKNPPPVEEVNTDNIEPPAGMASKKGAYGRDPILKVFAAAGVPPLDASVIETLPTWDQIIELFGPKPVIGGLDTCEAFRENVPAEERMVGSAGMFNTGTNLVTHLLKRNCVIPERFAKYGPDASKEAYGMRWQVPWGKHSPAKFKEEHITEKAEKSGINKEWIMPIVTIRHPYTWMHSMCKNGYTARWAHGRKGNNCPNLKPDGEWNGVTTKFADDRTLDSDSLAHLWNDWYKMYIEDAKYPRLVVRLEDLVFHAEATTTQICNCVGGEIRNDQNFTYVLDSAKADSPGHDKSTGFIQAWIKYAKPQPPRGGFRPDDFQAAEEALNLEYMNMFQYAHPPPADDDAP